MNPPEPMAGEVEQPVALTDEGSEVNVPGPGVTICTSQSPAPVAKDGVIVKVHVYWFGAVWVQVFVADDAALAIVAGRRPAIVSRATTKSSRVEIRVSVKKFSRGQGVRAAPGFRERRGMWGTLHLIAATHARGPEGAALLLLFLHCGTLGQVTYDRWHRGAGDWREGCGTLVFLPGSLVRHSNLHRCCGGGPTRSSARLVSIGINW